jgi:hypothetical protein
MPVGRSVAVAIISIVLLVGVALLVRPLIFSFATARDDRNYPVAAVGDVDDPADPPLLRELILNDFHGLPGEVRDGEHSRLTVVISPLPAGGFAVVNAWSTANECAVGIGQDRLVDCEGATWTWAGIPIQGDTPPLQAFPAVSRNGAVVVDFTAPRDAPGP